MHFLSHKLVLYYTELCATLCQDKRGKERQASGSTDTEMSSNIEEALNSRSGFRSKAKSWPNPGAKNIEETSKSTVDRAVQGKWSHMAEGCSVGCSLEEHLQFTFTLILDMRSNVDFIAGVPMPVCSQLTMSEVYRDGSTKPDWQKLKTHFKAEGRLEEEVALRILREGAAALKVEPNLLAICPPVTSRFGAIRRPQREV